MTPKLLRTAIILGMAMAAATAISLYGLYIAFL